MNVSMPTGTAHGWGIAGTNLAAEIAKLPPIDGVTLHCITGPDFRPFDESAWDRINIGYCFFENELLAYPFMAEAAGRWDHIVAGSSWCEQHLRRGGVERTSTILQGIDSSRFFLHPPRTADERFIVFSGGKFEFRKGQDIVIAAMKVFMERHKDVWLSCAWHNQWPSSIRTMEQTKLIGFDWQDIPCNEIFFNTILRNGLDPARVLLHPPFNNMRMPLIYAESDLGIFPNRCEGGNNMVMCEYMACGRTIIASDRTGHADVVTRENAFCLKNYQHVVSLIDNLETGNWSEPDPDEILELLEVAYRDRTLLRNKGESSALDMARLRWSKAAQQFHDLAARLASAHSDNSLTCPATTPQQYVDPEALFNAGRFDEAESQYRGLLRRSPLSAALHNALATVMDSQMRYQEAAAHYNKALSLQPEFHVARYNMANSLAHAGNIAEAIQELQTVVAKQPDFAEAWQNLGQYYYQKTLLSEALECLEQVIRLKPGSLEALRDLGRISCEHGLKDRALACFNQVLQKHPADVETLALMSKTLREVGRPENATVFMKKAVELSPENPEYWADLSALYVDLKNFGKALTCANAALAILPDDVGILNSRGLIQHELGEIDAAESSYKRALSIKPNDAVLCNNLGNIYKSRAMLSEALTWYDRALEADPDNATIIFNRSLAYLGLGDFKQGWQGYVRRFDMIPPVVLPHRDIPEWDGQALQGRRLLIQAEQVYGDTFMFARFIEKATRFGGPVVFECQDKITRNALGTLEEFLEMLIVRGEPMPEADLQIPLLSLPRLFNISMETIPCSAGYLKADPARVEHWKEKIPTTSGLLNIGLVWGGRKAPLNSDRSMQLTMLEPLFAISGTRFFSLQLGEDSRQVCAYSETVTDLSPFLTDFGETAAAITNLDLVITIDSAPAHLSGALGADTWVMLKYAPDWRWFHDRDDSPWYDSVCLFRQSKPGEWGGVVSSVATALMKKQGLNKNSKVCY